MRSWTRKLCMTVLCIAAVANMQAKDFDLVKDGKSVSTIVLRPNMSAVEAYAAVELATYLEKITGAAIPVKMAPEKGSYNIFLSAGSPQLPEAAQAQMYKVKDDGFLIHASDNGLYIVARQPRGVLFGAYEILKKYGDVRWFLPGDDGEYCPQKQTFSVPEQSTVTNPSFRERNFNLTGGPGGPRMLTTSKWMLRNNMTDWFLFSGDKTMGGHDFWTLLPKELFATHPELFPLVDGKRVAPSGQASDPGYANPCVSNPEALRLMTENAVKKINKDRAVTKYEILQNDTMTWCECENCKKLDSPKDRLNHRVSNRFWIFANAMIKAISDSTPSTKIQTMAYINAEEPPDQVKPDPRTDIKFCTVRRCYLHSIGDESCAVNKTFRVRLDGWRKLGMPVWTYEYSMFVPVGEKIYSPLERVYSEDMKYYKKIGLVGYCDERPPLVEDPKSFFIEPYLHGLHDSWLYDAIPRYLQAYFLWNADADFDAAMEDLGGKYYGKAWPAAMREYRALLRGAYERTPTHFLYGSPNIALGRVLDDAAAAKLSGLLEKALAAAKGDEKLTKRVMLDKEGFAGWLLRFKQCQSIPTTKLAKIGGAPTEKDWESAPVVTDFKSGAEKDAERKTIAKTLYDGKNIYFRVDALEPRMSAALSRKTTRDDKIWEDNDLEFFLVPPALGGKYLHLITNANGMVFDAMTLHASDSDIGFDAKAEVKTTALPDRWRAEVAIPFSSLGGAPKAGDSWKANVARTRKLADGTGEETSSWSGGSFHGADSYRSLVFPE